MATIRVLLADDHNLFREGLRQICEIKGGFNVVGEATNGEQAVRLAEDLRPDVILIDLNMPNLNGIEATAKIIKTNPQARIIILTMYQQEQHIFEAIKAGAKGYLLKNADAQELIAGVRQVYRGEALLDSRITAHVLDEFRRLSNHPESKSTNVAQLTEGEMDVLRLMSTGLENQTIAEQLSLSPQTVANRIRLIYQKLQVNNRTQAVLYALRRGWVTVGLES